MTKTVTSSSAVTASNTCAASDLTGTFAVLEGSAGAGNIVYTLHVTNASQTACTVAGFPDVTFIDANGAVMAQHTSDNGAHGTTVPVEPGASATAQVRFSPDVTPCDPGAATTLRVRMPDGSTFDVKIDPATKLCGAGSVQPSSFTGAD